MIEPAVELALQGAIVAALRAGDGVGVADRVYDEPPAEREYPYVTLGEDQVVGDDIGDEDDPCADGSEIFSNVHAWSQAVGWPEVKRIAGNIRTRIMRETVFALEGYRLEAKEFVQVLYLRDPDGKTRHAVIRFRFHVIKA
jgi:hypothetical protein